MTRMRQFWEAKPSQRDAETPLKEWYATTLEAEWANPADVKATFGKRVDFVQSDNGNDLVVFDILSGHYRMIVAIHYLTHHLKKGRVYVLRIMTHKEYDKNHWKRDL